MDPEDSVIELRLSDDLEREVKRVLLSRCADAVQGAKDRDNWLAYFDDLLNMRTGLSANRRWRGACNLDDPLTREIHYSQVAELTQALRRDPKIQVEAVSSEDEDLARQYERLLQDSDAEYDTDDRLSDVAHNACRDFAGISFQTWTQKTRKIYSSEFRDSETGEATDPSQFDPTRGYEEVRFAEEAVEVEGIETRTPDLADIYLYPPNAPGIESAIGVFERRLLLADDLWRGVKDFGYDADEVKDLVKQGGAGLATDWRQTRDTSEGVQAVTDPSDNYYECFLYVGKIPPLYDEEGDTQIPEQYHDGDIVAMICPEAGVVFKLDVYPYEWRPWDAWYMLRVPGRFEGLCVPAMVESLQVEMNAALRQTIDGMNFEMSPMMYMTPTQYTQFGKQTKTYPGAVIIRESPGDVEPVVMPARSAEGFQIHSLCYNRGKAMMTAQGLGELQPKVRKAAEIQNVMSQAVPKFDLVLQTFNQTLEDFYVKRLCLILRYRQNVRVRPFELRRRFRFLPTATSRTANPETRIAIAQQADNIQASYLQAKTLAMAGQMAPDDLVLVYNAKRQILMDLGIRQPETYLGPEPVPQAPPMGMPGMQGPGVGGQGSGVGGPQFPIANLGLPSMLLGQRLPAGMPPGGVPPPGVG